MNQNIAIYGNRQGCLSRACSGNRPPDHAFCATTSCHYSRDYQPGEGWKFYYKQQKLQEYEDRKHTLLRQLSPCHGADFMQCVLKGLRKIECDLMPTSTKMSEKFAPDFYVRPWQQHFVPALQEPPCPVHGFDKVSPGCVNDRLRSVLLPCSSLAACEQAMKEARNQCRNARYMLNDQLKYAPEPWQQHFVPALQEPPCPVHGFDQLKYAPEPAYLTQTCTQLPHVHPYLGVPQPCLPELNTEPLWCHPQFCRDDNLVYKSYKEIWNFP